MGIIFNLQPFSLHDGPGVRTAVFFKGCPLRCGWCHNPESQAFGPELMFHEARCANCGACASACPAAFSGKTARGTPACISCGACARACYPGALELTGYEIAPEALADRILRDKPLFDKSGGGATFTGGEPLAQPEFLLQTAALLGPRGVHMAVETALCAPAEVVEAVLPQMDLVLADLKCVTESTHIRGTGAPNAKILQNLRLAADISKALILRVPVIPGFNDDTGEMRKIAAFAARLRPKAAELLAFHGICAGKYSALGRTYAYAAAVPPDRETMERFAAEFSGLGIPALIRA